MEQPAAAIYNKALDDAMYWHKQVVLEEMPSIEITDEEQAIFESIWESEAILNLQTPGKKVEIPEALHMEFSKEIVPTDAKDISMYIYGRSISIEYLQGNLRTDIGIEKSAGEIVATIRITDLQTEVSYQNSGNMVWAKQEEQPPQMNGLKRALLGLILISGFYIVGLFVTSGSRIGRIVCMVLTIAMVMGGFAFMEIKYSGERLYEVSTNKDRILNEIPILEISDVEMDFYKELRNRSVMQDILTSGNVETQLSDEQELELFKDVLPESAELRYVTVDHATAMLLVTYTQEDWEVWIYCYLLEEEDSYLVNKMVADAERNVVYSNQGNQVWTKREAKHDWFSWMRALSRY